MSGGSEGEENLKDNQTAPAAEPTVEVAKEEFPPEYYLFKTAAEREVELADIERHSVAADRAADRRFEKGVSGNPRGRPRKVERSFVPRQQRRDIIRIAEAQMTIRTEKSKKKVSVIEAIMLRTAAKALAGHGPSIRLMMKWYTDAIAEHSETHEKRFHLLEDMEILAVLNPDQGGDWLPKRLNNMRKLTRRT
jgi:hypothetical protein